MALNSLQRRWLIGAALLLTLAAVWAVQQADEPADDAAGHKLDRPGIAPGLPTAKSGNSTGSTSVHSVAKVAVVHSDASNQHSILPEISDRRKQAISAGLPAPHADLLGAHAWYVPPVPQTVVYAPVEKPVAPPAPFQYLGKLEGSPQGTLIFLSTGNGIASTGSANKVQSVIPGQLINSAWRLDREDTSALYLTYLPLGTAQVLAKTKRLPATVQANASQGNYNQADANQTYANQIDANQLSNNNN